MCLCINLSRILMARMNSSSTMPTGPSPGLAFSVLSASIALPPDTQLFPSSFGVCSDGSLSQRLCQRVLDQEQLLLPPHTLSHCLPCPALLFFTTLSIVWDTIVRLPPLESRNLLSGQKLEQNLASSRFPTSSCCMNKHIHYIWIPKSQSDTSANCDAKTWWSSSGTRMVLSCSSGSFSGSMSHLVACILSPLHLVYIKLPLCIVSEIILQKDVTLSVTATQSAPYRSSCNQLHTSKYFPYHWLPHSFVMWEPRMSPLLKGALSTGGSRNDLVWLPLTLFYSVWFMHHLDPHTCPRVACSPGAWLLQLYLLQTQGPGLHPFCCVGAPDLASTYVPGCCSVCTDV